MKHICTILIVSLCLSSCGWKPKIGSPVMQKLLKQGPKDASNMFKLGWKDGCETGISVTSNRMQRHFYRFKQNYELSQNREYYTAWKTAYTFCQRYTFQYLRRVYF